MVKPLSDEVKLLNMYKVLERIAPFAEKGDVTLVLEQLMTGNVIKSLEENIDQLGYIHLADVPGSHEPGTGELHCNNILKALDSMGYAGFVGFELIPSTGRHSANFLSERRKYE